MIEGYTQPRPEGRGYIGPFKVLSKEVTEMPDGLFGRGRGVFTLIFLIVLLFGLIGALDP